MNQYGKLNNCLLFKGSVLYKLFEQLVRSFSLSICSFDAGKLLSTWCGVGTSAFTKPYCHC